MEKVQLSLEANAPTAETASLLIALLDQLINDCRYTGHSILSTAAYRSERSVVMNKRL